jgi:hypothetical protein
MRRVINRKQSRHAVLRINGLYLLTLVTLSASLEFLITLPIG